MGQILIQNLKTISLMIPFVIITSIDVDGYPSRFTKYFDVTKNYLNLESLENT